MACTIGQGYEARRRSRAASDHPDQRIVAWAQSGTDSRSDWLEDIRRNLMSGGGLRRLMAEVGRRGMTSNPTVFEKVIAGSRDYDDVCDMALAGQSRQTIYETLNQRVNALPAAMEWEPRQKL
jgi:hypothetical protein